MTTYTENTLRRGHDDPTGEKIARGLGWFSILLGMSELVCGRALARWLGMPGTETLVRTYGVREITTGIGILASADPTPWIWSRVVGDALDAGSLAAGLHDENPREGNVAMALANIIAVTVLDVYCAHRLSAEQRPALPAHHDYSNRSGLPSSAYRQRRRGNTDHTATGTALEAAAQASITIPRPADDLRALWLSPKAQTRIWEHFAEVTAVNDRTADWTAHGPAGGAYRWRTQTEETGTDQVRWSTLDGADVPNAGSLTFRPAPGDRGTELHLTVRFDPPGGAVGQVVSKLFHIVPREIVLTALYRFRALALTGELPLTDPQPAARNGGVNH